MQSRPIQRLPLVYRSYRLAPVTTVVISGAGTAALHPAKLIGAGFEAVGGVLSSVLVIV